MVFRAGRGENQRECLPTAYKPQLITRRSLVQVQPPQPNKKGTQTGAFFIWFDLASDGSQPPAGGTSASLKCGRNLRFPHKRPLPFLRKRCTCRSKVTTLPISERAALLSFSFAKGHACCGCSLASALPTPPLRYQPFASGYGAAGFPLPL